MTLPLAEDWLKAVAADTLGSAVTVMFGSHDWDYEYLKRMAVDLPVVIIVWDGGSARDATSLTLDASWTLYVVNGWKGGTSDERRRAALTGAYAIMTLLASRLHNASMGEERQYSADGSVISGADPIEGFGRLRVESVINENSGSDERIGVVVYAIELSQDMPLEGPETTGFDDWLRTAASFDIPEGDEFDIETDTIGEDGDAASRFDMPQT